MAKKKTISVNYLDQVPKINPEFPWRVKKNGMVEFDMENKGFYSKIAQKFWKKPKVSHISLDKYGTKVWTSIDGVNTVGDIIRIMEEAFPEEKDRMLDRVVTYMATLQNNKFTII